MCDALSVFLVNPFNFLLVWAIAWNYNAHVSPKCTEKKECVLWRVWLCPVRVLNYKIDNFRRKNIKTESSLNFFVLTTSWYFVRMKMYDVKLKYVFSKKERPLYLRLNHNIYHTIFWFFSACFGKIIYINPNEKVWIFYLIGK